MTITTTAATQHPPLTSTNRTGLMIAGGLGVLDVVSVFIFPTGSDTEPGPPVGIVVLGVLLGLLTVGLALRALRTGSRPLIRAVAGTRILSVITALPAFFVDVDAWIKASVAVVVLLTVTAVVLMFRPSGERARVVD